MLKTLKGKGILIHHWDTDGICSTRLLLDYLSDKEITNKTPILGNYYLTDDEVKKYSKYDFVIVADMALTEENVNKLAKNAKVLIFDHHLGKVYENAFHHNPVIKGENPDDYPSASWIINDYLKNKVNIFAILGIIGDHEQKIKNNKRFSKIINDFCEENNLTFEHLHKMVYLLDSNYKLGNKEIVEEAPRYLLKNSFPNDILNNKQWNDNLSKLDEEMNKQLNAPGEEMGDIIIKRMSTPYNIISTITRKIAWSSGKNTVVINTGFYKDKDQLYVRSKKNAEPMIMRGKSLGLKCGGKKEVLGAIVPKEQTDSFLQEILDFLKK
jgi:single-stranded DNA-specific DHH superfamily exonuclease